MGEGAAAPTLAGPRRSPAAVRSEQPPDPRGAGADPERAPRRAPRSGHRVSEALPPGSPDAPAPPRRGSSVSEEPGRCWPLSAAFLRSPSFGDSLARPTRRGGGGGARRRGAAAVGAERKWHARVLEAEVAEDGGRRCRDSVGETGESDRGERGARAPAGYGEACAALSLRPPHPRAPTLRATGPGSGSSHRRRPRHPEDRRKVWIWGRTRH